MKRGFTHFPRRWGTRQRGGLWNRGMSVLLVCEGKFPAVYFGIDKASYSLESEDNRRHQDEIAEKSRQDGRRSQESEVDGRPGRRERERKESQEQRYRSRY